MNTNQITRISHWDNLEEELPMTLFVRGDKVHFYIKPTKVSLRRLLYTVIQFQDKGQGRHHLIYGKNGGWSYTAKIAQLREG